MQSLKDYILEERLTYEAEQRLDIIMKEISLDESMFDGKTNGKTWWEDIRDAGGTAKDKGVGLFGKIAALFALGAAGIKKFWDWLGGEDKKRIEKNGGRWPGIRTKTKKKVKTGKIDVSDINIMSGIDKKWVEDIIERTDSSDSNKKTGFGDFFKNYEEFAENFKGFNHKNDKYFCPTYGGDYLALIVLNRYSVQNNDHVTVYCKFVNDVKSFEVTEEKTIDALLPILDKIQDKYPDWKIKGFYFYFEDKMTSNKIGKLKKLKDTDFYVYTPETDANESMTNEDLDADNLMWKLDKWFETHEEEKNQFTEMISKYNQTVDVKELEKDLKNTPLQDNLKEFVNFMFDDLDFSTEKDYLYQLKKIIEYIKGKKVNF
jgi:hypothetical protein